MELIKNFDDKNNVWKLMLSGEIDIYNADDLKRELHALIEERPVDIEIDCTELKYIDSTGLGVLVSTLKKIKGHDGKVKLINLKPHIAKVFYLTGLTKIMDIEEIKDAE